MKIEDPKDNEELQEGNHEDDILKTASNNNDDNDDNVAGHISKIAFLFKFILILFFIFIVYLLILQSQIKLGNFKKKFNEELVSILLKDNSSVKDFNLKINGALKYKSFPIPHIVATNITGENIYYKNYNMDLSIKNIYFKLSFLDILLKQIVFEKIRINDAVVTIKAETMEEKLDFINPLVGYLFNDLSSHRNLIFITKNCQVIFENDKFTREFKNIDADVTVGNKILFISSKLSTNNQVLNIKSNIKIGNNLYNGDLSINSQAFTSKMTFQYNSNSNVLEGKYNLDALNFQLFSKSIFNSNSFPYRRIIDNDKMKLSFNYHFNDKELRIDEMNFDGSNLKAGGKFTYFYNGDRDSEFHFNIEHINFDKLIIKTITGEVDNNKKDIFIYSKNVNSSVEGLENKIELSDEVESIKYGILFDIKVKSLIYNANKIENSRLNFSFGKELILKDIFVEFTPKTALKIVDNKINLYGDNLGEFVNIFRNTQYSSENNFKGSFDFHGFASYENDRIFIKSSEYISDNFSSKNQLEIGLKKGGINYIALDITSDKLNIDDYIVKKEGEKKDLSSENLKNELLFLNNFNLNTFIRFNLGETLYKGNSFNNNTFIIETKHGYLNIYDINLNDKILGNLSVDILQINPVIKLYLNINNLDVKNNINLNELIFSVPMLEGFFGDVKIYGKNINFKNSNISQLSIASTIDSGVFKLSTFELEGFGGKCSIEGFMSMQYDRKLNIKFNACIADLKDVLYLFTNSNIISGNFGFSSILYSHGININQFRENYIFKTQLIASGVKVDKIALSDFNDILFKVNEDETLLDNFDSDKILFNSEKNTLLEKVSGDINYSGKNKGDVKLSFSRPMINGTLITKYDFADSGYVSLDGNINYVMLSGTLAKIIPLTISSAISGELPNNLKIVTNYKQVDEYLQNIKKGLEELHRKRELEKADKAEFINL